MKTLRSGPMAVLCGCTLAAATVAPCSAAVTTLDFDFSAADYQSADWSLPGDSSWVNDGNLSPNKRIRLTYGSTEKSGGAWYTGSQFDLGSGDWSFSYRGQISYRSSQGADGMSMNLYAGDVSYIPSVDGGSAPASIVSVTLDTYDNGASDPSAYHLTLWHENTKLGEVNLSGENDVAFDISLAYVQATNTLTASYVKGAYTQTITATEAFTETELLALDAVNWGFSARTGGEVENHDVLSASATYEVSAVPEPSGALGLAGLIAGSAFLRRRKAA